MRKAIEVFVLISLLFALLLGPRGPHPEKWEVVDTCHLPVGRGAWQQFMVTCAHSLGRAAWK